MLVLNPRSVTFGGETWPSVERVTIERRAERLAVSRADAGPHVAFADVAEQLVTIEVRQALSGPGQPEPAMSAEAELAFIVGPTAGDAGQRRVRVRAVVTGVRYEVGRGVAARRVELIAVSEDGLSDPVREEAGGPA